MRLTTVGPIETGVESVKSAVTRAVSGMRDKVRMVILYLPIQADHSAYLNAIASVTDALIVGATTGGAAFTERGFTETGAVVGILADDDKIRSELILGLKVDTHERVRQAAQMLSSEHKRLSQKPLALLAFADAYACDGEVLAQALREGTPPHARILGGTAGDSFTFTQTKIFHRNKALSDAAVLIALPAPPGFDVRARHGFSTIENARDMLVTKIEGNLLKELDGEPAVEAYQRELMRLKVMRPGDDLLTCMGIYELAARSLLDDGALRIRTALNLAGNTVVLASSIPEGSVVKVAAAGPEQLIGAARKLSEESMGKLAEPHGALVFDCAARRKLLGARYGEQVAAFGSAKRTPYLGLASYGELAKGAGQLAVFHNTTAVMAAF